MEIDEDGNGKYYVENIKTGKIVAVKTKKEAQEKIQNPKSFDYGEGQPVLEDFRTQTEQVTAPLAIKTEPGTQTEQVTQL